MDKRHDGKDRSMEMILMEDIVRDGHPALRKKSEVVPIPPTKEDVETLDKMMTYLQHSQDDEMAEKYDLRAGVGLAAPQIGVNKQLFVMHFTYNDTLYSYKIVNPKIISHSVEQAYLSSGEGCLSVDEKIEGYVVRHARITLRAFDETGKEMKLRLRGYPAIVAQHEIDHLHGIMFYDHINKENPFYAPDGAIAIE